MTTNRWTVMFDSDMEPATVFSTLRTEIGDLLAWKAEVVIGE